MIEQKNDARDSSKANALKVLQTNANKSVKTDLFESAVATSAAKFMLISLSTAYLKVEQKHERINSTTLVVASDKETQ